MLIFSLKAVLFCVFYDTATTETYTYCHTLSLHYSLPISFCRFGDCPPYGALLRKLPPLTAILKLACPIAVSAAPPLVVPAGQLTPSQSYSVVPTGQTSAGGVPATRVPDTVKLALS